MPRSKSSSRWLQEHFADPFVKQSQKDGYRSRASYKLIEIDDKYKLLKPASSVLDLGAAPGGWTQVAAQRIGSKGFVLATDILPMDGVAETTFIQGDFSEDEVFEQLISVLSNRRLDLVMSDMAPNLSGMKDIDQPRSMYLVELALDIAIKTLRPGGSFLTKVFHGEGFDELIKQTRQTFDKVTAVKPSASRSRSRETYMLARGFNG